MDIIAELAESYKWTLKFIRTLKAGRIYRWIFKNEHF